MLSVLRIVAGLLFFAHGAQKLLAYPASDMSPEFLSLSWLAGALERLREVLLRIWYNGGMSPFAGRTGPTTSVTGRPGAVKPFSTATRAWHSATGRWRSPGAQALARQVHAVPLRLCAASAVVAAPPPPEGSTKAP